MKILRQTTTDSGEEVNLGYRGQIYWQGFVLTGLPKGFQQHEDKPKTLSAAVMIWNKVAKTNERLSVQEVSAMISGSGAPH